MPSMFKTKNGTHAVGVSTAALGTPPAPRDSWEIVGVEFGVRDGALVAAEPHYVEIVVPSRDGDITIVREITTTLTAGASDGGYVSLNGAETPLKAAASVVGTYKRATTGATITPDSFVMTVYYR